MSRALILNASWEPLCVVPLRRAVLLVLAEKAEVIHAGEGEFRSASLRFPIPSVIRLTRYIRVPRRVTARLTNRSVLARDNHTCQYCGKKISGAQATIDHVRPRAQGGLHRWENVVAACRPDNSKKADRTPEQAGMKLLRKPFAPKETQYLVIGIANVSPEWEPYLNGSFAMA